MVNTQNIILSYQGASSCLQAHYQNIQGVTITNRHPMIAPNVIFYCTYIVTFIRTLTYVTGYTPYMSLSHVRHFLIISA